MADQEKPRDVKLLKGTTISVFVDEALQDMLVVTYELGVRMFKGVLLDYTKRNLPHGVTQLHPTFKIDSKEKVNPDDDILYSVNQRFAYMDPNLAKPKNVRIPSKYKNNKMTVRLRPRQVLCSKCKGICNENSENVSKKRKPQENVPPPPPKRAANAPVTRSAYSEQSKSKKDQKPEPVLIPKISRLLPQDISNAMNGNLESLSRSSDKKKEIKITSENVKMKCSDSDDDDDENEIIAARVDHSMHHSDSSNSSHSDSNLPFTSQDSEISTKSGKRMLRKKRSVGSMEDLWDENDFEEAKNLDPSNNAAAVEIPEQSQINSNPGSCINNTRTIKISYGPEGTVLKIPAPIEKFNTSDDSEENINSLNHDPSKEVDNKAARKALKRARKKARQKRLLSNTSPSHIAALSPRYSIGGHSSRYAVVGASPRHCIGNNSPRYVTSTTELHVPKRHKHKLKRKKKHRDDKDRKCKEEEVISAQHIVAKEQNVTQKLSINLKRLNNTYTSCPSVSDKGEDNSSSSDDQSEQAPDFPPPSQPIIFRVNTQSIPSVIGADGGRLLVGDVVWGKIQGFPWWPGKVLNFTASGNQGPQAHVAWFGSSTSSLIQCDQLCNYLDNFKIRYNKKKRGAYKEAVRQATTDAKENAELKLKRETSIMNSPSQSIMTVPPPALASPREIDVMS